MPGETRLTVFHDDPFWVGVFERTISGSLSVCKVTCGADCNDFEVYEYLLEHYRELEFSPAVETEVRKTADNPKRRQREASRQLAAYGIGTKSQQALQMQREMQKTERKQITRAEREAEEKRRFALKQEKRKEKHRGH